MTLRRPQTEAVSPVQKPVGAKWSEALVNLATAVLALALVAGAGVLFVLFIILRRGLMAVWLPVERSLSIVAYAIIGIFLALFEQLVGFLVVGALMGGGIYLALEYSPKLKASINGFTAKIQRGVQEITGFDLHIPSLHETMDILTSRGPGDNPNPLHPVNIESQVRELERIKDVQMPNAAMLQAQVPGLQLPNMQLPNMQLPHIPNAAELQSIVSRKLLPKEFTPLLGVVMQPEMLAQFKVLAESGALQKGATVALPLLQKGLYSQDAGLSSASLQVLAGMQQSPEAKKMLADYQQILLKVMNDAARNSAHTGY